MLTTIPTEARIREIYENFAQARLDRLAEAFDENVDFISHAPTDFFPYLGRRTGRPAVLEAIAETHRALQVITLKPISILLDGNRAALTLIIGVRDRSTGKSAGYLGAHFLHFRQGRIRKFTSIVDSLDAAKQLTNQENLSLSH